MAFLFALIAIGLIVYLVAHVSFDDASEDDPWIDSERETMDAIDRLLDAGDHARQEMRRVAGRIGTSDRSLFSDKDR